MRLIEILKSSDINAEEAIARLGNDEFIYMTICNKFLQDTNYVLFQKDIINLDYKSAQMHIHTLRGVAANLGFHRLELICKTIMNQLLSETKNELMSKVEELTYEYNRIITIIKSVI